MISVIEGELQNLAGFPKRRNKLEIFAREKPALATTFFPKLARSPFTCAGEVNKQNALGDIAGILEEAVSSDIQSLPFYRVWLRDMASIAKLYCAIEKSNTIRFWLGTNRGCKRYHIDNVPCRLLVTYYGKGTEWLPDDAVDRKAYEKGEPNEAIVTNPNAIQHIDEWNIAVFRGLSEGLLHRTPDVALNSPSVLMRLDHVDFG